VKNSRSLIALAVVGLVSFGSTSVAQASNRGKHIVGGFGSHHRGGHMVGHRTNRGMHIVGGHGSHHRGGHMVR
jgi:hypothetical protein